MRKDDIEFFHYSGMTNDSSHYQKDKRLASRKHGVREGQWLWVRRKSFTSPDELDDYRVKVICITKYYVALQYPAGFVECAAWDVFEQMLT